MILIDTSVWIDHFRAEPGTESVVDLLLEDQLLLHPWVMGELALGNLSQHRRQTLADLELLPQAPRVADEEVLELVRARKLQGRGIGWVDVQLLASALVAEARLWSLDQKLSRVAADLGIGL